MHALVANFSLCLLLRKESRQKRQSTRKVRVLKCVGAFSRRARSEEVKGRLERAAAERNGETERGGDGRYDRSSALRKKRRRAGGSGQEKQKKQSLEAGKCGQKPRTTAEEGRQTNSGKARANDASSCLSTDCASDPASWVPPRPLQLRTLGPLFAFVIHPCCRKNAKSLASLEASTAKGRLTTSSWQTPPRVSCKRST